MKLVIMLPLTRACVTYDYVMIKEKKEFYQSKRQWLPSAPVMN